MTEFQRNGQIKNVWIKIIIQVSIFKIWCDNRTLKFSLKIKTSIIKYNIYKINECNVLCAMCDYNEEILWNNIWIK